MDLYKVNPLYTNMIFKCQVSSVKWFKTPYVGGRWIGLKKPYWIYIHLGCFNPIQSICISNLELLDT